jgi:hypothetical protein
MVSGMPGPLPLPDDVVGRPVRPADLRERGISASVFRGSTWQSVTHGVHVRGVEHLSLVDRCRGLGLVLTSDPVVSHVSAAALWGMPLWGPPVADVHVTREPSASAIRRAGVVNHRAELPRDHRDSVQGVAVTTPARTLLDLASVLPLDQLVATGDYCLRSLGVRPWELGEMVAWAVGRRGVAALRSAVPLLDARAESPPESLLRVWFSLCGLPPFEPNAEIWDGRQFVARVDLLDRDRRLVVEYEGAYHRTREQYAADIGRRARLAELGFEVVQIEATMMRSPGRVVRQVAQRLVRLGWTGVPRFAGVNRATVTKTTRAPRPSEHFRATRRG